MVLLINNSLLRIRIVAVDDVRCFPVPLLNNVMLPFVSNSNATPDVMRAQLGPKGRGF
jgi:hypothetical protein